MTNALETKPRDAHRPQSSSLVFGLLIVLVGTVFLLNGLDLLGAYGPFDFWPLLLVFFGAVHLLLPKDAPHRILGILLIAAGLIFQGDQLDLIDLRLGAILPMFVIAFGVYVLGSAWYQRRGGPPEGESPDAVSEIAVFGGSKTANRSRNFRGGEALAIFGGCDLDLTRASIEGDQAVIYARALFGGVDIRVPEDWDVVIKGIGILGGYEDKTRHPKSDEVEGKPKQLIVRGYAVFGGVDLKN
jgi:predicted membrane protein